MEHDGGRYHIETSPLIFGANQWTDFYMITASVMKELILNRCAPTHNILWGNLEAYIGHHI